MATAKLHVTRRPERFDSDDRRVILRYLNLVHPPRIRSILRRVLKLPEKQVSTMLAEVMAGFRRRHRDLRAAFAESYEQAIQHMRPTPDISEDRRLLIGSYFTMEYSIESAALFNPSIVPHPDQSNLLAGATRFLMSLRATGEGHVSSIVFRRGVIDASGGMTFDPPPRYAFSARSQPDQVFEKAVFCGKFRQAGLCEGILKPVIDALDDPFTTAELKATIRKVGEKVDDRKAFREAANQVLWLTEANYTLSFPQDCMPAEIVIFPATLHEQHGMEDLRLTRFVEEDGKLDYYGTYTAYDGLRTHPMLLATTDFHTFHVSTLAGRYVKNKGMALFPRKVDGHYLMLARHDGENLFLLHSRNLYMWNSSLKLQAPRQSWELLQVGNCGSPLETEAGWLVLTHGVGPLRQYCIGAILLDLADPSRVIGRLREPLLAPTASERKGYVPNVLYTCGSMIHQGRLIIPYAISDSRTAFATVSVGPLVEALRQAGP